MPTNLITPRVWRKPRSFATIEACVASKAEGSHRFSNLRTLTKSSCGPGVRARGFLSGEQQKLHALISSWGMDYSPIWLGRNMRKTTRHRLPPLTWRND